MEEDRPHPGPHAKHAEYLAWCHPPSDYPKRGRGGMKNEKQKWMKTLAKRSACLCLRFQLEGSRTDETGGGGYFSWR